MQKTCIPDEDQRSQRMVKSAVKDIRTSTTYNSPTTDDLCMDVSIKDDWSAMEKLTQDKSKWNRLVQNLKTTATALTATSATAPTH